jgi:putative endonuclease
MSDSYPPRRTRVQLPIPLQRSQTRPFFMKHTVYILFSEKHLKHYTGVTSNLEMRLKSHNEFGKDWTAKFRPWKFIFSKVFDEKKAAMEYEKWLKSGIGRDFIKNIKH